MIALKIILILIFGIAGFCIVWSMAGYNLSLKILNKMGFAKKAKKTDAKPTVTVMIVAHNEEAVIQSKL